MEAEKAVDPSDVFWYNIKIEEDKRNKSVFFSYLMLVMILIGVFALLLSLQALKNKIQDNVDEESEGHK